MRIPPFRMGIVFCSTVLVCVGMASGQNYPTKPIRIITAEAGGGVDFTTRLITQGLSANLGQPVIVDNRPSRAMPEDIVAKAPPDGYTLLCYSSLVWLSPFLRDDVPYDPIRDFLPVTLAVSFFNVLVVNPTLAPKSVNELITFARARPGELNYAFTSAGTSSHLAAELFKAMAGINIVAVSYRGTSQGLNDLLGNRVQVMFPPVGPVIPHIKSGRLRPLGITSAQPSTVLPNLPTVAAAGLPGYEALNTYGVFAPAKTPSALITRLNQEIVRVLNLPDVKEKFFNAGIETVGSSPEQFAATIKSDMARWGKVIKDAGIRGE